MVKQNSFSLKTNLYIIAEAGSSHDGELSKAVSLIKHCASAGANAIKFQLFNAERLAKRRGVSADLYRAYQVPLDWLPILRQTALEYDIDLALSVYDEEDLRAAKYEADILKVSSFEASDLRLVEACALTGKPVIVSTGMTTGPELMRLRLALKLLQRKGASSIAVLHCVSAYPTKMNDLNLSSISHYRLDGFSDHSHNTLTGALAVAHGARILEVHVRAYATNVKNPDYPHSLDIAQLFEYVRNATLSYAAIGAPRSAVLHCEEACAPFKISRKKVKA